jgi:hypothetical protein
MEKKLEKNFMTGIFLVCILTWGSALAQSIVELPPAGHFTMRADLVGTHPRLYFTQDDIPGIRSRASGSSQWYLDQAKGAFGHYTGSAVDANESWKHYLFGFWGQFAMNMFYLVEGDVAYANTAVAWALHYARQTDWLEDDLIPMEITSGMAITYDILYDYMSESDRVEIRTALKTAIDFIYDEFFIGEYWTNDFQNNHMHNRIHGMANACFAIYGDDPGMDVQAAADLALSTTEKVVEWLPVDGSNHEGPGYWDYGNHWVVRLVNLMEHVTGIHLTSRNPHFSRDYYFRIYMTAPGWRNTFNIGDGGDGSPSSITPMSLAIAESQDGYGTAILREFMDLLPGGFYNHAAWGLLWYDGELEAEPYSSLPLWRFWPDLEMLSVRSSWESDATAFVFKCGPPGGHRMQQLSAGHYINVAHDHPDQNHFMLFAHGTMLAEDDGYPQEQKLSRSHNTVIVDGLGQTREGTGWYQPFPYEETGYLDDVVLSRSTAYAAGNAGILYEGADRFVRHIAFMEGEYVMIIDDLEGTGSTSHEYEWRLHKDGDWTSGGAGQFFVSDGGVRLDIRFLEPAAANMQSSFLPAELTAQPCLAVSTSGVTVRFTSVLVPQNNEAPDKTSQLITAPGGTAVRVDDGGTRDFFAVNLDGSSLQFGNFTTDASAVLARHTSGQLNMALMSRGTSLTAGGITVLGSTMPVNAIWRSDTEGILVEIEPPYKSTAGNITLQAGGFTAGVEYPVNIDGRLLAPVTPNSEGVVSIEIDVVRRHTIRFFDYTRIRKFHHHPNSGLNLDISPVPGALQFSVDIEKPGALRLEIYDLTGRKVWEHYVSNAAQGTYRVRCNVTGQKQIQNGIYIINLQVGDEYIQRKTLKNVLLIPNNPLLFRKRGNI